jgi:hypothetical protein
MLANAVLLPQGGSPRKITNTKARLRGAVVSAMARTRRSR